MLTIASGTTHIVTFRNKSTFALKTNKIAALLGDVILAPDINKVGKLFLEKNATITGTPTWTDVNTNNSVLEYSTNAVVSYGTGKELIARPIPRSGVVDKSYKDKNFLLFPNETATFYFVTTGSGELGFSIDWTEQF